MRMQNKGRSIKTLQLSEERLLEHVQDRQDLTSIFRIGSNLFVMQEFSDGQIVVWFARTDSKARYVVFNPDGTRTWADERKWPDVSKPQRDFFPAYIPIIDVIGGSLRQEVEEAIKEAIFG